MDLLKKLAKNTIEKVAEKKVAQEEERYSPADRIKIAAANLCNFVAAVKANGRHIKTASAENGEVNHELVVKLAGLYVADHYKAAGLISNLKGSNIRSPELDQAFSLYKKQTGKSPNEMSAAEIGEYVMKIRNQRQTLKGKPSGE